MRSPNDVAGGQLTTLNCSAGQESAVGGIQLADLTRRDILRSDGTRAGDPGRQARKLFKQDGEKV